MMITACLLHLLELLFNNVVKTYALKLRCYDADTSRLESKAFCLFCVFQGELSDEISKIYIQYLCDCSFYRLF
jgi:hypothetical protein